MTTEVLMKAAIRFPKLGFELLNLPDKINVFGIQITFYGILIACAMLCGLLLTEKLAKRTKQNTEFYLDFAIRAIIAGIFGARTAYVMVRWMEYKQMPAQIFSLKNGGLSFFGAVAAVTLVAYFYCKRKKYSLPELCDTVVPGVLLGQIIGRLGDFFNRDILGSYSDGLFAMQVNIQDIDAKMLMLPRATIVEHNTYIQMHPVFLYEIVWNLILLILLIVLYKKRKFQGEIVYSYLFGYGMIRLITEFIRLDAVYLGNSKVTGGMVVSIAIMLYAIVAFVKGFLLYLRDKKVHESKHS